MPLGPVDPFVGPLRPVTVRVYADEEHRRAVLGWEVRFFRTVERANPLLRARFGAELVIESVRPWTRTGIGDLGGALEDLVQLEPQPDVDLIIGLTSPLGAPTGSVHQLGRARVLSPYLVLRGMDDLAEAQAWAQTLRLLDEDERQALYRERLRHKEVVVLLHELGHALGAPHVDWPGAVMRPIYERDAATFMEPDGWAMDLGLSGKGLSRGDPEVQANLRKALAQLYRRRRDFGDQRSRAELVAWLEERPQQVFDDVAWAEEGQDEPQGRVPPSGPGSAGLEPPPPPPKSADQRLEEARRLGASDVEAAWIMAQAIAEEPPEALPGERIAPVDPAHLSAVLCELASRRRPSDADTQDRCRQAAEGEPKSAQPWLLYAWVLTRRDQVTEAERALDEATRRLMDEGGDPTRWLMVAQLERGLLRLEAAEQAVARAQDLPEALEVAASLAEVRRIYELRPGERAGALRGVAVTGYARGMGPFRRALGRRDFASAQKQLETLERDYGRAAPHDELCKTLLELRQLKAARPSCERSAALWTDSPRPLLHLGLLELLSARFGPAVKILERAQAMDPDRPEIWKLLHAAERGRGNRIGMQRIEAAYQAHFGRSLGGG